jgi:hypothetical protein
LVRRKDIGIGTSFLTGSNNREKVAVNRKKLPSTGKVAVNRKNLVAKFLRNN